MSKLLQQYFGIRYPSRNQRAPKHIQQQIMAKADAKAQRKLARGSLDGTHGWNRGQ